MELFSVVFSNIFSIDVLLICFIGTLAGIVLGAIPGMNGGIGIAVMLPFTYSMQPAQSLLFLGGMYLGSSYGGSISGILINCPGTAESACTTFEGYQMTKRGEGKHALYYSIFSSGFGSIVGLICLLLFAPVLAKVSVKFGPAEMMLLAICGLTIVGSLTGKNVINGLIAALFGLFLGMIGVEEATGAMRFTLGLRTLRGGINLIPAVIGLFAITEMVKQGMGLFNTEEVTEMKLIPVKVSKILKNIKSKYLGILIRSSLVGTLIGVLPGTGAAIASFIAYGDAKSSDKEGTFGKGNAAGIIAPESANNAAVGGSLVPMLSLGIPGSATSAIMFGALTIQGMVPGQSLFTEHAGTVYTFLIGMFVVAIFMVLIGVFGIPMFSKIVKIKMKFIIPVVILFSLIGAYSVNNSMGDVTIAIVLGLIGVLFAKVEIPNTPIVLGLILGQIVENNLVRTMTIVNAESINIFSYIFTRPICWVIVFVTAYLIISNIRVIKKSKLIKEESNIEMDLNEE